MMISQIASRFLFLYLQYLTYLLILLRYIKLEFLISHFNQYKESHQNESYFQNVAGTNTNARGSHACLCTRWW